MPIIVQAYANVPFPSFLEKLYMLRELTYLTLGTVGTHMSILKGTYFQQFRVTTLFGVSYVFIKFKSLI